MSEDINEYVVKQCKLLAAERQTEVEQVWISSSSSARLTELEHIGVAVAKLSLINVRDVVGGRLALELATRGGRTVCVPLLSSGDVVTVFAHGRRRKDSEPKKNEVASKNALQVNDKQLEGVLTVLEEKRLEVIVDYSETEESWVVMEDPHTLFAVVRVGSDVTHKRCLSALNEFKNAVDDVCHPANRFLNVLFRNEEARFQDDKSLTLDQGQRNAIKHLNDSQRQAVRHALCAKDVTVFHGPPGTGKTSALVAYIAAEASRGSRILVTAPSNIAVDNLAEKLVVMQTIVPFKFVRAGHPARVLPAVVEHTLEARLAQSEEAGLARDCRVELAELETRVRSTRKLAERRLIRAEKRDLLRELRKRENDALCRLLRRVNVVLATSVGAGSRMLDSATSLAPFDVVCIDEAGQAQEAACLIALLRGKRAVFAGDPFQLPPTIKNAAAEADGLGRTFLDRIFESKRLKIQCVRMLTEQYRMNHVISNWSSNAFYGGLLRPAACVANHLLKDLPHVLDRCCTDDMASFEKSQPWVLIDTAGCDFTESSERDNEFNAKGNSSAAYGKESSQSLFQSSRYNQGEVSLVVEHVNMLLRAGLKNSDIGVISPYSGQVILLRSKLRDFVGVDVEIATVDSFQGREKEAIVLSLVRSNSNGEVGFLADIRRLNVAITRARRHVCIICDSVTISQHRFLSDLIDYASEHGDYRAADIENGNVSTIPSLSALTTKGIFTESLPSSTARKKSSRQSAISVRHREKSRIKSDIDYHSIRNTMVEFLCDTNAVEKKFPSSLSSASRRFVHELAEQNNLVHHTEAIGNKRCIFVRKSSS